MCHKFQRGQCLKGDLCSRIHTQHSSSQEGEAQNAAEAAASAEAARHAGLETTGIAQRTREEVLSDGLVRSLKEALRHQLNIDIEQMDTQARKRKMKVYQRLIHPDKWMEWPQMVQVMTEVEKELNSKRMRYEVGNSI